MIEYYPVVSHAEAMAAIPVVLSGSLWVARIGEYVGRGIDPELARLSVLNEWRRICLRRAVELAQVG